MLGNMLNDLAEAIRRWTEKKIKFPHGISLPTRHDGAYRHDSGCSDHSIWDSRPSKGRDDMGMV